MRCGSCKATDVTVEHVRECYETGGVSENISSAPAVEVPEGYFTVVQGGEHVTLRLRRQPEDSGFKPGVVLVALLVGPSNESDYLNFGHVTDDGALHVWRRFKDESEYAEAARRVLDNTDEARDLFDEVISAAPCLRCGRMLTVPASVNSGYGPVCAEKVGAA